MRELIQVDQSLRIMNLPNDKDLASTIAYCVKICGLNNPMTSEDKHLLIQKTKDFFGFLHLDELKLAFDFAIQGITKCEIRHFQNFSIAYFTAIVNAYLDYRNKESALIAHNRPVEEIVRIDVAVELAQKEFDENVINPMFETYKKLKSVELGSVPVKFVYKSLVEYHKILEFTKEQKAVIRSKIESDIESLNAFTPKNSSEPKSLKDLLGQEKYNLSVVERCQLHCVELCFEQMLKNEELKK